MTQSNAAFKLKASFFPITVIKFQRSDQRSVLQQLKEVQRTAPNYFNQSPVIIDVTDLKRPAKGLDLAKLVQTLRQHQLMPVGAQGLLPAEAASAKELGLALWRASASTESASTSAQVGETSAEYTPRQESEEPAPAALLPPKCSNTIVTKPVRSGMRVYAKQSNLILLAPVSSGAECIADGDVFCYAPVRGRLLAGAGGDLQAQIFCQSLEAELIAIAGYYLLYDEYPVEKTGHFQIVVQENKLHINNWARSVMPANVFI